MLLMSYWSERMKAQLQVKGMSQVWTDKPGWYFWLDQEPGPLSLQLERTEVLSATHSELKRGLFSLRLFPHPHEAVFSRFSPEEREQIQSDHFDNTGTPDFHSISHVPSNMFQIGVLEWLLDQGRETSYFVFESLTELRIRRPEGAPAELSSEGTGAAPNLGTLIRDVPGWDLGIPLFDMILCLYAYYRKQAPVRIVLTRSPGFENIMGKDGSLTEREANDIWGLAALVCFAPPGLSPENDLHVNQQVKEFLGDAHPLADTSYPQGYDTKMTNEFQYLHINEQWWSLAEKTSA
jgi:hypothetical protein